MKRRDWTAIPATRTKRGLRLASIDFDTLGEKPELLNAVTLRDRDTMKQDRVKIDDLLPRLLEKVR